MIVDDEESVRWFVERVLVDAGYRIVVASDGPEAIEIASKADKIDLLITDMIMPEMQGDELARRLRNSEPQLKVLYLTGYSDRLFNDKITLWQDEAFLEKPCSVKGLQQAVSMLLFGGLDESG